MEQQQPLVPRALAIERSTLPSALKAMDGSILAANHKLTSLFGLHHTDHRQDTETSRLRHAVSDAWQAQDQLVMSQMRPLLMLDVIRCCDDDMTPIWRPLLTTKFPAFDPQTSQPAVLMQCEPFHHSLLSRLSLLNAGLPDTGTGHNTPLTSREKGVLYLLLRGATVKEIAQTLSISENTVRNHYLVNLKRKFDTSSLAKVIQRGINAGGLLLLPESRQESWLTMPLTDESPELSYPRL